MRVINIDNLAQRPAPCVATIGFFDGVHLGHRFLIRHVVEEAAADGIASTLITFDCHPRQVLQKGYAPKLINTPKEKLRLLALTGADNCMVLNFDLKLSQMPAYAFMKTVLKERLNVRKLFIGYDHRFGHGRSENFADYVRYGKELGITVLQSPAFAPEGLHFSSTAVRSAIEKGNFGLANRLLGHPYTLSGRVVKGFQEGRKMGFPTANLSMESRTLLLPANGVYAVKAHLQGHETPFQGMLNIGNRPTFGGESTSAEANIFGFNGNLYGQEVRLDVHQRIREEVRFNSPEALAAQLQRDKAYVTDYFNQAQQA